MRNVDVGEEVELLANLVNLKILNMRSCSISDISFIAGCSRLEELDLRNNDIVDITALENTNNLKELDLRNNEIRDITALGNISSLEKLDLRYNDIADITALGNISNLKELDLRNNDIIDIAALGNIITLEELNLRNNHIADIAALGNITALKELDLRENKITDITALENIKTLKGLNLRNNDITDITALSGLKELVYLNIHSNKNIESIEPIAGLTGLQILIMRNVNAGKEIGSLANLVNLKILNMRSCSISDISFIAGCSRLEELNLRNNDITDIIALVNIKTLKELNLRNNDITDITALSGLKELVYLNIHSNKNIESIEPIAGLANLQTLIMRNVNAGKEIGSLANLVNLKILNIRSCSISDISFIADLLAAGAFQDDPITGKKARLDIRDNPIFTSHEDSLASIRPYWQNISLRAPFILPLAVSTLESPEFSHPGGFYKESFLLKINLSDPEAIIFYTLDGSEPTRSSNLYTGPIKIDSRKGEPNIFSNIPTSPSFKKPDEEVFKATVIRAQAFKDDSSTSKIITNTYFIDEKNEGHKNRYSLPLISITTDSGNLFDYNYGIFVPGLYSGNENSKKSGNYFKKGIYWERPIHIEFFEPDGSLGFAQNAGIRVQGGSTRYLPNKSMRIYARDLYDNKDMFDYPIFPGLLKPNSSETLMHFKSFILRNSGNDSKKTYFRDGMLQDLVSHLGFDTQAYRPAIVFINGEYWGIYNIREDYNDWYITTHYDIDMSEVAILEERDARVEVGVPEDNIHYLKMVQFINESVDAGTIDDPGVYEYINTLMDIDNFIDYFASQIFVLNNDWPQNNIRFWRLRTEVYQPDAIYGHDGRWRWMMFDTDLGFALWGQSPDYNTLDRSEERNKLFSLLLKNNEFKYQFINTMSDLINSIFRTEWTIQKVEDTQSVLAPEMLEHLKRWTYMDTSIEEWKENVQEMITFAQDRPSSQIQHINEFFSLNGTSEINLIADPQKGYIKINSLELKEGTPGIDNPANWKGIYFKEVPVHITAVPYPGYEFSGWTETGNNEPSITITLEEDLALTATFKELPQ